MGEGGASRHPVGVVDLSTSYLGLKLAHPLVPGASPLTYELDSVLSLEDAGAPAIVLHSLFEEQISADPLRTARTPMDPVGYLEHLNRIKEAVHVPVIASLNGTTDEGWTSFASLVEQAGADALELNVYFIAADPDETADAVEQRYVELVEAVRAEITIPLAVKIGPFFSSVGHIAHRLVAAGADGLVLFNRFMQPDIDLETLTVDPSLHLSTSDELALPLRWIGVLRDRVHASLACTTGVHTAEDALKVLLVGADVTMMASALLHEGPTHVTTVLDGIETWLAEHDYEGVEQMKGSMSMRNVPNPVAFARANYARLITSFTSPYDWRMAEPEGELRS